jgi:hypothetical protein
VIQLNGDGGGQLSSSDTFTINGVEFKDGIVKLRTLKLVKSLLLNINTMTLSVGKHQP